MQTPTIIDVPIQAAIDIFDAALDHARRQRRPHDVWLHPMHDAAVGLARSSDGTYLATLTDAGIWSIAGTHVRFDESVPADVAQVRLRASFAHDTLRPHAGASG